MLCFAPNSPAVHRFDPLESLRVFSLLTSTRPVIPWLVPFFVPFPGWLSQWLHYACVVLGILDLTSLHHVCVVSFFAHQATFSIPLIDRRSI